MFASRVAKAKPNSASSALSRPSINNHDALRRLASKSSGLDNGSKEREAETAARAVLNPARQFPSIASAAGSSGRSETPTHSTGKPIDSASVRLMESRFKHDFSKVRIHNDNAAHSAAGN